MTMLNVDEIRKQFPILSTQNHGHPLVYFDNAATTQMPEVVLNKLIEHYHTSNANVHRGVHSLSQKSTTDFEEAREKVTRFIGAESSNSIVFTKGATEAINKVALGIEGRIKAGDRIVVSMLEHHSNFVPWQQLCERTGASLIVVDLNESGDIDLEKLQEILYEPTALVAVTACSNVLGTVTPIQAITELAHTAGALCLIDGAQIMRHALINVQSIGCDFFCFSGHKIMAPTGIGVLYAAPHAVDVLEPVEFGGEMVDTVSTERTTFAKEPLCFEAGTPNYVGAIMLGYALDFLTACGREDIVLHEEALVGYAEDVFAQIEGLQILGSPQKRAGCLSFSVDRVHPFDLCLLADKLGLALRSGNNCAQPLLHEYLGLQNVARASFAFYNTFEEIDHAAGIIERVIPLVKSN